MKKIMNRKIFCISILFLVMACQSNSSWIYSDISCDSDLIPVLCLDTNGKFTYLDLKKGDMATKASYYESASYFYKGRACVEKDGLYQFIDKNFNPINDKSYVEVGVFNDGLAFAVEEFGKITAIDIRGNTVFELPFAQYVYPFREGVAVFKNQEEKWGAVNTKGEIVVEPVFDNLSKIAYNGFLAAEQDEQWGIVSTNGKIVIPCEYSYVYLNKNSKQIGSIVVEDEQEVLSAIDFDNNIVFKGKDSYDELYADRDGLFYFKDIYAGWVDKKGEIVIPEKYVPMNKVRLFGNNKITVVSEDEETFYMINTRGKKISGIPNVSWIDDAFDENGLILFASNSFGAMNTKGEIVIMDTYPDNIIHLVDDIYLGERNGTIDVINSSGKIQKTFPGSYRIFEQNKLEDCSVENRYVDVDGIISDINSILKENSIPNGSTPGLVMAKYNKELNSLVSKENF